MRRMSSTPLPSWWGGSSAAGIRVPVRSTMAAAKEFFRSANSGTGLVPDRVTTDGHGSYPREIHSSLGRHVEHRTSGYKKTAGARPSGRERPYPMYAWLKEFEAAKRFCRGCDELRTFLRLCTHHNHYVPARRRRLLHLRRTTTLLAILRTA